ncbi:hypothetical protein EW145_g4732 [Phellinidium pouzarii]|uniref:Zn(2)-C6 fungal-type domain-containing protein n=1 Tax=Phellinidium pouzarii TaxID=167371 RepID=A0A4S4L2Z6_9AGAM|nr:hypothetical protein EW145_g4732 [Phellinidium pouzarii]
MSSHTRFEPHNDHVSITLVSSRTPDTQSTFHEERNTGLASVYWQDPKFRKLTDQELIELLCKHKRPDDFGAYLELRRRSIHLLKTLPPTDLVVLARDAKRALAAEVMDCIIKDIIYLNETSYRSEIGDMKDVGTKYVLALRNILHIACSNDWRGFNEHILALFQALTLATRGSDTLPDLAEDIVIRIVKSIIAQPSGRETQNATSMDLLLKSVEELSSDKFFRVGSPELSLSWNLFLFIQTMLDRGNDPLVLTLLQILVQKGIILPHAMKISGQVPDSFRVVTMSVLFRSCVHHGWLDGMMRLLRAEDLTKENLTEYYGELVNDIISISITRERSSQLTRFSRLISYILSQNPAIRLRESCIRRFYNTALHMHDGSAAEIFYTALRSPRVRENHVYSLPDKRVLAWLLEHIVKVSKKADVGKLLAQHLVESQTPLDIYQRANIIGLCAAGSYVDETRILWERYASGPDKAVVTGHARCMLKIVKLFSKWSALKIKKEQAKHGELSRRSLIAHSSARYSSALIAYPSSDKSIQHSEDKHVISPEAAKESYNENILQSVHAHDDYPTDEDNLSCQGRNTGKPDDNHAYTVSEHEAHGRGKSNIIQEAVASSSAVSRFFDRDSAEMISGNDVQARSFNEYTDFACVVLEEFRVAKSPLRLASHYDLNAFARASDVLGFSRQSTIALKLLVSRREIPDAYDLNIVVAAMAVRDPHCAERMVKRMVRSGVGVNSQTFSTVINGALARGCLRLAQRVYDEALRLGYTDLSSKAAALRLEKRRISTRRTRTIFSELVEGTESAGGEPRPSTDSELDTWDKSNGREGDEQEVHVVVKSDRGVPEEVEWAAEYELGLGGLFAGQMSTNEAIEMDAALGEEGDWERDTGVGVGMMSGREGPRRRHTKKNTQVTPAFIRPVSFCAVLGSCFLSYFSPASPSRYVHRTRKERTRISLSRVDTSVRLARSQGEGPRKANQTQPLPHTRLRIGLLHAALLPASDPTHPYPPSTPLVHANILLISESMVFSNNRRQSQSCDACRARKVRCARDNQDDPQTSCKHCIALGIPCTYDYQPKKRGPPNLYLRRLQEAAAAAAAAAAQSAGNVQESTEASSPGAGGLTKSPRQRPTVVPSQSSPYLESTLSPIASISTSVPIPPSRYPIAADTYHPQYPASSRSAPNNSPASDSYNTYPLYNWFATYKQQAQLPLPPPNALPPLSYYYRPHRLEDVAPRETIMLIISLFFDFVYPLTPCVHKPSFMTDLHARREERDPLFFALVMSTCRADTVYHFCEGHDATSHASFGETAHIAVTLHMHEEASYEGLDPIECEVRRRTFWLLFGADKSMSILLGRPICLRDEDCTLHFPKEVDDEYITLTGILPQPHGKTAMVSGLNYISRIFALLGEIQVRIRVDKRSPPQGPFATARLEEVRSLHTRIMSALMHAPAPLRLKTTFAEVKDFFDNPNASRANASNAFLVMQANLYVTQEQEIAVAEGREAVASDLLNVLHSIPIQSIATNGPSLVHKVRFVASTLLDAVRKAETAPASAARAHAYLWDFLSILSEIERNYLLDDDRDGGSSGDGAPVLGS